MDSRSESLSSYSVHVPLLSLVFLTAFATLFRDRPWASSLGPSADVAAGPFMAGVDAGLLALWGGSEGTGLVEG